MKEIAVFPLILQRGAVASLPFGDEEMGDDSFAIEDRPGPDELRDAYAGRMGGTPEIRDALQTIFDEARRNTAPDELSGRARQAFLDLNRAIGLRSQDLDGVPGSAESFDRMRPSRPETRRLSAGAIYTMESSDWSEHFLTGP